MKATYPHSNNALDYLPRKPLVKYSRGQTIYSGAHHSLYAVAEGRVKVSSIGGGGREAVLKIVECEGLFGESCLMGGAPDERAVALETVHLMSWDCEQIEQLIEKKPLLGLALIEELAATGLEMQDRLQVMSDCKTPERVMFTLLEFARTLGTERPDGATRVPSLPHRLIAQHVGTSREIVSSRMSHLRQIGLLTYTRKHVEVYCDAIQEFLERKGVKLRHRDPVPGGTVGRTGQGAVS